MAKNRKNNDNDEPNTAPEPDRWYNLSLGSSFVDHRPSPKFCTLRCKSQYPINCLRVLFVCPENWGKWKLSEYHIWIMISLLWKKI